MVSGQQRGRWEEVIVSEHDGLPHESLVKAGLVGHEEETALFGRVQTAQVGLVRKSRAASLSDSQVARASRFPTVNIVYIYGTRDGYGSYS